MNGPYFFGSHAGHLTVRADKIAAKYGAAHVNYTEPSGRRRGWFECDNRGSPFNQATANNVMQHIDSLGGIESMLCKRDRTQEPMHPMARYMFGRY